MEQDIDVITFERPSTNDRNLYLTNLPPNNSDFELHDTLFKIFSKFGLLYEVQIMETSNGASAHQVANADSMQDNSDRSSYAFVKFYSQKSAFNAKKNMTGRLYLQGHLAKIKFANRKKQNNCQPLYICKCHELANHYLGFNGWTATILSMKEDLDSKIQYPNKCRFVCAVKLDLVKQGLHSEGVGVAEQTWQPADSCSKGVAICRARKQAHSHAVENAFSKIIIMQLGNGKTFVEVNTTVEDLLYYEEDLDKTTLLQVNEVDTAPEDDTDTENTEDMDVLNIQLLKELENDSF